MSAHRPGVCHRQQEAVVVGNVKVLVLEGARIYRFPAGPVACRQVMPHLACNPATVLSLQACKSVLMRPQAAAMMLALFVKSPPWIMNPARSRLVLSVISCLERGELQAGCTGRARSKGNTWYNPMECRPLVMQNHAVCCLALQQHTGASAHEMLKRADRLSP